MMKKLLFIMLVCAVATSAWAAEIQWFGGAHDRDWFNAANWNSNLIPPGPVPTANDKAKLNYVWANPGPIISAPGAVAGEIFISEDRDLGTVGEQSLTVATGGVLNTGGGIGYAGQVILGYYGADDRIPLPANEGRLIMAGGTATIGPAGGGGGHLFVGFSGIGHLEVDAGLLTVTNMFGLGWNGGSGTVDISGGELNTEAWNFSNASSYSFNFSALRTALGDGEWVQNHYWQVEIQALVDAGKITTTVPGAHVQVDWDPVLQQTHVYAIPEPVSIVMLGLGALLLRKRS
ncbi:MAG: hypothetical protein ABSE89_11600 [Sedimentisphaerales bacterium]